nr:hypothetical protein [Streptococcus suis]
MANFIIELSDKIYYAKLSKKMAEKVETLVLLVYNIIVLSSFFQMNIIFERQNRLI